MLSTWTEAQEGIAEKRQPETRILDSTAIRKDSLGAPLKSTLPKIDLPEFVITQPATIDLPPVEKQPAQEDAPVVAVSELLNPPLSRTRETVQTELNWKETVLDQGRRIFNGMAFASLGTFFSPQAELWFGQSLGDYLYSLDGRYDRTKGFAPYTDRSGGGLGLEGATILKSNNPYLDQSNLHGALRYASDTYNWYGTRQPFHSRSRADFSLMADLSDGGVGSWPRAGDLGVHSLQVSDSSSNVTETLLLLGGMTRFSVSSYPLNAKIAITQGGISSGGSSSNLTHIEAMVGSQRYTWNSFSFQGSVHAYLGHGMGEQSLLRLYPHFDVAYQVSPDHTLRAKYAPLVELSSLASSILANRYLSAFSEIRHVDDQYDGTLAFESLWSTTVRSKFEVRVRSLVDYPLYADSLSKGAWLLAYGGRTTIANLSGEIFAKLRANDYFASALTVTLSRNSLTGTEVPYLPRFEVGCSYSRQFIEGLTGSAELTLIHQRKDNVVNSNTLPSILLIGVRGRYQLFEQAGLFLSIQNLLNGQYEYWKGYQESPFVIAAGISIRW